MRGMGSAAEVANKASEMTAPYTLLELLLAGQIVSLRNTGACCPVGVSHLGAGYSGVL